MIGRIAYGALFCLVLPALLWAWARATSAIIGPPAYGRLPLGIALIGLGACLFVTGTITLWRRGRGLPMSPFPPPKLVVSGVFAVLPHPLYIGFCLIVFGTAMAGRSASGLWLVGPAVAAGCAALVYGLEKPDLIRRFGRESLRAIRILPAATAERPGLRDCLRFFLFVQIPWLAIYEVIAVLNVQSGSLDTRLPFEARLPVWTWTEAIYASAYPVALLAPILTRTRRDLRELMVRSWLAMATVFPLYLFLPTHAPFRPIADSGWLGDLLLFERAVDMPAEALPSFHVIWAMLAGCALRSRAAMVWAAAVSVSCVTTGMHSIADVVAGGLWGWGLIRRERIWQAILGCCERIANSWREWRIGRFRLINHAFYGGLATFVCLAIVGSLVSDVTSVAITALAGLAGAAVWAQWVEGSSKLMRPFGFYGGLFAVIAASWLTADSWLMLGAYSVAGPWLQGIGRLRCLVQGCCHGRPADPGTGIRHTHPRSRVVRISGMAGVPLYPTALYSILGNLLTALITARLWRVGAPLSLIGGVFLLSNGLARFVEEAYRGEPQTPIYGGLRMYQWIAIGTVVAGAVVTTIPTPAAPPGSFSVAAIAVAAGIGVVAGLALGFDVPESKRRFGRLT